MIIGKANNRVSQMSVRGKALIRTSSLALGAAILIAAPFAALAQDPPARAVRYGTPGVTQPLTAAEIARENPTNVLTGSLVGNTPEIHKSEGGMSIKVTKLAEGLSHPNGLVFLPDGSMLITERAGRLRLFRNGALDPTPVSGVPEMDHTALGGLQDIVLHPDFARNHILYISYSRNRLPALGTTLAVSRAALVTTTPLPPPAAAGAPPAPPPPVPASVRALYDSLAPVPRPQIAAAVRAFLALLMQRCAACGRLTPPSGLNGDERPHLHSWILFKRLRPSSDAMYKSLCFPPSCTPSLSSSSPGLHPSLGCIRVSAPR